METLSNRINEYDWEDEAIGVEAVKQFIKDILSNPLVGDRAKEVIDELAGEKLI